jgi:cytoskeletal protein CcmA (bactofilin family)
MASAETSGFRPEKENVVYVGAGVTLKGQISVPALIIVDGAVDGDVTARSVNVGRTGVIRGTIAATEADVSGLVASHIEIERLLVVRSTGRVEGRVVYGEIELEKGAVVTGDLSVKANRVAGAKPVAPAKVAAPERQEAAAVAAEAKAGGSIDRLNEAVRAAKDGAAKEVAGKEVAGKDVAAAKELPRRPSDAAESRRRNILRLPLSSRRASA